MKIQGKSDWSHVYIEETPKEYMLFSAEHNYAVPNYAMRYLLPLFQKISSDLSRPVNVMDLGSSYGILSTLSWYDITWGELIEFYTKNRSDTDVIEAIKQFYAKHPKRQSQYKPNFYLVDSSEPAIEFSKQFNLCNEGYVVDLKKDELTTELKTSASKADVFLCVGSLSYFGVNFFKQVLPLLNERNFPTILAFSTYPLFYYESCADEIESEFRTYGYEFIRCVKPGKGRSMTAEEYQNLKDGKYQIQSDLCTFENDGYLTSVFYMAVPQDRKTFFENWLADVDAHF